MNDDVIRSKNTYTEYFRSLSFAYLIPPTTTKVYLFNNEPFFLVFTHLLQRLYSDVDPFDEAVVGLFLCSCVHTLLLAL